MWSNDGTFEEFEDDAEVELLQETLSLGKSCIIFYFIKGFRVFNCLKFAAIQKLNLVVLCIERKSQAGKVAGT